MDDTSTKSNALTNSSLNIRRGNEDGDETRLSVAQLLRVLKGVAVATKAHKDIVKPLAAWISQHDARHCAHTSQGSSDIQDVAVDDNQSLSGDTQSIQAWIAGIAYNSLTDDEELRQLAKLTLGVAILRELSLCGRDHKPGDLDKIWCLIHDALTGPQGKKFHFTTSRSAQGFLTVPLCSLIQEGRIDELFRFHVWLPDGERGMAEVAIHAHQPFAQSWVLAGYGTNQTYEIEGANDFSSATYAEYIPRWSDGKQASSTYKTHQTSSTVTNTGKFVRVTPVRREEHTHDMTYSVPAGVHHQTIVPSGRFHATLFFFDSKRGFSQNASVIGPKEGKDYTQLRDTATMTSFALAQMTNATRSWEKSKNLRSVNDEEHSTVIGYYRYFQGLALLQAGQHADALKQFNSSGWPPVHAFCKDPTDEHRHYLRALIEAGADLDGVDDAGYKPLDYAVYRGDIKTEALILEGLRQQLHGDIERKIRRRQFEAMVRKEYHDLFEEWLRPVLRSGFGNTLERMRQVYAHAIAAEKVKRRTFDQLRYVLYSDFCRSGRLPRHSDGTLQAYSADCDRDGRINNADHIVFFSYRWVHKDPITGKTAPDDKLHTQYHRMLSALEQYLALHLNIDRDKLGIWIVSRITETEHLAVGLTS